MKWSKPRMVAPEYERRMRRWLGIHAILLMMVIAMYPHDEQLTRGGTP